MLFSATVSMLKYGLSLIAKTRLLELLRLATDKPHIYCYKKLCFNLPRKMKGSDTT